MAVRCHSFANTAIVSDHPQLAAALSCALGRRDTYLPVMDGPRLGRTDRESEIVRRSNTLARSDVDATLLAGLSAESEAVMLNACRKPSAKLSGYTADAQPSASVRLHHLAISKMADFRRV